MGSSVVGLLMMAAFMAATASAGPGERHHGRQPGVGQPGVRVVRHGRGPGCRDRADRAGGRGVAVGDTQMLCDDAAPDSSRSAK